MFANPPARVFLPDGPGVEHFDQARVQIRRIKRRVDTMDGRNPEITLRRAASLLNDRHNFASLTTPNWWIGVGTALGFARERGFIAGDTDIDIRIGLDYAGNGAAFDSASEIVALFRDRGFRQYRELYWDGRIMQTALADTTNHDVAVDVYYFYAGISDGHYVHLNDQTFRKKPRRFIDNKRTLPWPGHDDILVNVPYPVEDYLAWRFGPGWRVPKEKGPVFAGDHACLLPLPKVTVLTYGTFDLLHHGHLRLLERARAMGDQLMVGVVSDELCAIKDKKPWQDESVRAAAIRNLGWADEVFLQRELDQKEKDIERFGVSYLVVGDDWKGHPRFEQVRGYMGCEIVYLPRTPDISSSQIKAAAPRKALG